MFPVISIGPLAIHAPGMLLLAGIWAAMYTAERRAAGFDLDREWLGNTLLLALAAGIISARLAFVLPAASAYLSDPWALIRPELNSFDLVWGIIGALGMILLRFRQRGILSLTRLAVLIPAAVILYAAAGIADLAAGAHYGLPTALPWGITLWDSTRHPTQLYRVLGAMLTIGIWQYSRARLAPAHQLRLVTALLAVTTVISDGFLADGPVFPGGIRPSQVLAWVILAGAWPAPRPADATDGLPTASQS